MTVLAVDSIVGRVVTTSSAENSNFAKNKIPKCCINNLPLFDFNGNHKNNIKGGS